MLRILSSQLQRLGALLLPLSALVALGAPAAGQSVSAKLFAKADGDDVVAAIQLRPAPGCWIYDDDNPGEFAKPTLVTLGEVEGATWSAVVFPEPTTKPGPFGDNYVFKKKTLAYAIARGAAAAGVDPAEVTAHLDGQVCNEGVCVNVEEDLAVAGAGDEKVWGGFPDSLRAAAAGGDGHEGGAEGLQAWSPKFGAEVAVARYFARQDGDVVEVVVQVAVPENFHMYGGPTQEDMGTGIGIPTTVEVASEETEFGPAQFPKPHALVVPPLFEGEEATYMWSYDGAFLFGLEGEALEDEVDLEALEIAVEGQVCDDAGCTQVAFAPEYAGEGDDALYAAAFATWERPAAPDLGGESEGASGEGGAASEAVAPAIDGDGGAAADGADAEGTEEEKPNFFAFLWAAIAAGLATLLMPCTYPMIPITISYFTKQAEARGGKVAPLALLYGLGIIVTFVVSGVVLRGVISEFANHWVTNLFIGIVFIAFACSLFGMFELRPPQFIMRFAGGANQKGGYLGVFLMGLTLVVTSFTCTGPFVGSLIAGGVKYTTPQIAIGMAAFGATMAAPFVVLALLPGKASAMPSAGGWMNTVKVFMGFVELAAAMKFLSNADFERRWWILTREVFLLSWVVIFAVAGLYLLGRINLKGESPDGKIGPGRLVAAVATLCFAGYCGLGVIGYELDGKLMSAFAPPPKYSRGLVSTHRPVAGLGQELPKWIEASQGGFIAEDDFELAASFARERNLGLLVNFTAHT